MADNRPDKRLPATGTSLVQRFATANQVRQRQAVAALKERMRVHIASQVFRGGELQSTRVLFDGEFYDVDRSVLAKLRAGSTPRELELEPVDCGEDC